MSIVVAAGLGACSGSDDPPSAAATTQRANQNRDRWTLPLDDYFGLSYSISDYAEALLIEECMAAEGYKYPTGKPQRMDSPPAPTENSVYRSLFDVEIAREFGYGGPAVEPRTASLTAGELAALESKEGGAAFDRCVTAARQELPLPPDRDLVQSLTSASYNSARESEAVQEAASKWVECMAPAGVSDLPPTPEGMPTDSLRAQWGEDPQSADNPALLPPSPHEIEIAVLDARCQESSGFAQALYEAEWDVQAKMLTDNEDALERLEAANDDHAKLVEEILTTRG